MTSCIYGSDTFEEGAVICVNGRGLRCVAGEWQETGLPCGEGELTDGAAPLAPSNRPSTEPDDPPAKAAKR